jgi:hypothetical protein
MLTKELPLSRGLVAIVDDEDFEWVSEHKWYAQKGLWPYVRRNIWVDGRCKTILLHRVILELMIEARHIYADHRNGDVLDNRRSNLRVCDNELNQANRRAKRDSGHGYKGIALQPSGRWSAKINVHGQRKHLGTFGCAEEAARAYDRAALESWGDFARLNFPRPISCGGVVLSKEDR